MSYKAFFNTTAAAAIAIALGMTACSTPSTEDPTAAESPKEATEQPAAETETPAPAKADGEKADEKATTETDGEKADGEKADEKATTEVDMTEPAKVVQVVFDAAKSEDFESLKELCDPTGENDEDTQRICKLSTEDKDKGEFVESFAEGKVTGDAVISEDGTEATVPVAFGPSGENAEEVKLVNRDGKWYLFSF